MDNNTKWLRETYERAMTKARECQVQIMEHRQAMYDSGRNDRQSAVESLLQERNAWMAEAKRFSDMLCDVAKLHMSCLVHIDESGRLVLAQGGFSSGDEYVVGGGQ